MQGAYTVAGEILTPAKAMNNDWNLPAAEQFHKDLQDIPSVVYTKFAAYATIVPTSLFNELADTGHPIGQDLQKRFQRQGVAYYATACGPNPVNGITQEVYLRDHCSFYKQHPPGTQLTENGTPLPKDGTPLPDPDPEKHEIIPYLTKSILYDALPALAAGGDDLVTKLKVLDTESMALQKSSHKIVGTFENSGIHPARMAFVISTLLKGALYNCVSKS